MFHLFPLQFRREWMEIDDAMFIRHGIQVASIVFGIAQYAV